MPAMPDRPRFASVYYTGPDGVLRVVSGPLYAVVPIVDAPTPLDLIRTRPRARPVRYRVALGDEVLDLDGRFEVFLWEGGPDGAQ